jgi:hypothetical protein
MNQKVKNMLTHLVDENAVAFKQETEKALYEKVNQRIQDAYKNMANSLIRGNNETNNGTN